MHHPDLGVAVERRLPYEALVEHASERVDVRARIDGQTLDLLGGRIVDGADEEARSCEAARGGVLDDPEVGQVDVLGRLCDEDVPRFDVAVDEVASMRGIEPVRRLLEDVQRPPNPQRAVSPDQDLEIAALDVAHGDEELTLGLAGIEDRHHVRVIELGRPPRLALKAVAVGLIVAEHRSEQLQRDAAAEAHVLGQVHDAHTAAPEERLDAIAREFRSDASGVAGTHVVSPLPPRIRWFVSLGIRRGEAIVRECDWAVQGTARRRLDSSASAAFTRHTSLRSVRP